MTDDSELPAPPSSGSDERLDEFRALVRAAFEQAMNSGKPGWEEMTSAVLKNRLLNLTERQFSENRYGSPSFIHLVRRVPDLLDVAGDSPPFHIKIREPLTQKEDLSSIDGGLTSSRIHLSAAVLPEAGWRNVRVRDDLWRAIMDYNSGNRYVLDPETGLARPEQTDDSGLTQAPTASREDVSSWRQEFISSLAGLTKSRYENELEQWLASGGPQTELPRPIRGRWVEHVKRKVGQRLLAWFESQGKPPPADMLLTSETRGLPATEALDEVVRTRQLRDLIIRAVRTMTYEELASVSLPASVILRISGNRASHDG